MSDGSSPLLPLQGLNFSLAYYSAFPCSPSMSVFPIPCCGIRSDPHLHCIATTWLQRQHQTALTVNTGSSQTQLLSVVKILLDSNSTFYNYYHGLAQVGAYRKGQDGQRPPDNSGVNPLSVKHEGERKDRMGCNDGPTRGEAGVSKTPEAVRRNC